MVNQRWDAYANVLFVSRYLDRPSVFNFNLITKQTRLSGVILGKSSCSQSFADHNSVFITTANRYGIHSGLRYIYDARIFLMKREEEQNNEIAVIGKGVQLYTLWENRDTFKVNITSIDTVDSRKIVQKIFPFDLKGKSLAEIRKRSFDLIRDGFPAPPKRFPTEISPNNRFRFREVSSQGESYIYLRDFNEKSEQLTVSTKRKIRDGRWSDDGNYLYIITEPDKIVSQKQKLNQPESFFIIDAVEKSL